MDEHQPEKRFIDYLDKYKESLQRLCSAYTSNPSDREDLFQSVVLAIWEALPTFDGRSHLSTWGYRIALRVCWSGKHKTLGSKSLRACRFDGIEMCQTREVDVQDAAQTREQLEQLRTCIRSLNQVDRALIALRLEQLSHREIAEVLGISENLSAVRLKRIGDKLRQCMERNQ